MKLLKAKLLLVIVKLQWRHFSKSLEGLALPHFTLHPFSFFSPLFPPLFPCPIFLSLLSLSSPAFPLYLSFPFFLLLFPALFSSCLPSPFRSLHFSIHYPLSPYFVSLCPFSFPLPSPFIFFRVGSLKIQLGGLRERHKLSQLVLARSPSRNRIWGILVM